MRSYEFGIQPPNPPYPWNISPPLFHDYPFSSVPFLHDYPLHSDSTLLHLYPFPSGPAPLDLYPFPSGQSLYICIPLCQVLLIFCTIIPFIQASLMALSSLLFSCRFYSVAAFFTRPSSSTPPLTHRDNVEKNRPPYISRRARGTRNAKKPERSPRSG